MIIRNAARCRACGDEVESKKRHDFVTCTCKNLSVDGGRFYLRRIGPGIDDGTWEELSETTGERS